MIGTNILVGRRAVFTRIATKYDETKKEMIEVSREQFRGVIAALYTHGQNHYPYVVMLYDDGSLKSHDIERVTIECGSADGLYR